MSLYYVILFNGAFTGTGFSANLTPAQIAAFLSNPTTSAAELLANATTRIVYDLGVFQQTQAANPSGPTQWQPVFASTIARETHVSALREGQTSRLQISFGYSDGMGRVIQQKLWAESGPVQLNGTTVNIRWLGSGWVIFNNKGKPVRQYEPFFSSTQEFEFAAITGVSPILFYDPLVRVVATLHPNQTWEKVVFDPWAQQNWDVNDTVLIANPALDADVGGYFQRIPTSDYLPTWHTQASTGNAQQQDAASKAAAHANTPALAYFDTLGRTFLTFVDNGPDSNGNAQEFATRTELDIQSYQRSVSDALGRKVMTYDYEMLGAKLHSNSVDAGERWTLSDALGKPLLGWNSRGFTTQRTYDVLRRPLGLYVQSLNGSQTLAENIIYGEDQAASANLNGRVYQSFDPAGVVTNIGFDFKGNLLSSQRQLLKDYSAYMQPIDWSIPQAFNEAFVTSTTYDALNRPTTQTTPDGSVVTPTYNQTTLLQTVSKTMSGNTTSLVTNITYDPKSQRLSISYGNGASTAYTYDPLTFRLTELTTTRSTDNVVLQDLIYTYDPVGNVTQLQDNAQDTVYYNNAQVLPNAAYTYDPIYRLIQASGRELLGLNTQPVPTTWDDSSRLAQALPPNPNDGQALAGYAENYEYDAVGNILSLMHSRGSGNWTRTYNYDQPNPTPTNNRLTSTVVGSITEKYTYDYDGNMASITYLPTMKWDFKDQLQSTSLQVVTNGGTPGITYYVYDSSGQRVIKFTQNPAAEGQTPVQTAQRIYLGNYEIYREYRAGKSTVSLERQTLHIMDDKRRVAMVETKTIDQDVAATSLPVRVTRYQFDNHLNSAVLELDDTASIISYEEYFPYGSTSYQAVSSTIEVSGKRYRFTGKERDEESGLYYHGARYYASWIGRWTSCDPAALVDGPGLYGYARGNPVTLRDPNGMQVATPDPPKLDLNMSQIQLYGLDQPRDRATMTSATVEQTLPKHDLDIQLPKLRALAARELAAKEALQDNPASGFAAAVGGLMGYDDVEDRALRAAPAGEFLLALGGVADMKGSMERVSAGDPAPALGPDIVNVLPVLRPGAVNSRGQLALPADPSTLAVYNWALQAPQTPVIGRLAQTDSYLLSPGSLVIQNRPPGPWTLGINDAFMEAGIRAGKPFELATQPSNLVLQSTGLDVPEGQRVNPSRTPKIGQPYVVGGGAGLGPSGGPVLERELMQLNQNGYFYYEGKMIKPNFGFWPDETDNH